MGEQEPRVIRSSGFVPIEEVLEEVSQAEGDEWDGLQNLRRMMEAGPTQSDNDTDPGL